MLEGPAGFGKAVLMAQWAAKASDEGIAISWHKISKGDNCQETLIANISHLLGGKLPYQIIGKHILFIDRLERLQDAGSIGALNNLIEAASQTFFFVIASRKGNIIPISEHRSHNQLEYIGAEELKFSRKEISVLFKNKLDEDHIDNLCKITSGWPVALWYEQNRQEGGEDLLAELTESDTIHLSSELKEFINEQIFSEMEPSLREALTEMSIFKRFTAKQASHVCGVKNFTKEIIRQHLSPLVYSVEEGAAYFYFNPLFREYLRKKLFENDEAMIKLLHQKATHWYETRDAPYEAIYHAAEAEDTGRMMKLFVSAGGVEIGLRKGVASLERIVALFPLEIEESEPQLLLARALLYMKEGKLNIGHSFLDRAGQKMAESGYDPALDYYESIVVMLLSVYEDNDVSLSEIAKFEENAKHAMPERFWSQGWFNNLLCMMYYSVGEMTKAKEAASIALEFYSLSDAVYSQIFAHIHLALINHVLGDLKRCNHELAAARNLCKEHFAPDAGLTAIVQVLLAELKYEQGDDKAARQLITKSLKKIEEREGWVDVFTRGYVTASYLAFNRGANDKAFKILDQGSAIAGRRNLPRLKRIMEIQRLELLTLSGDLEQARSLINSLFLEPYLTAPDKLKLGTFQEMYRTVQALARYCLMTGAAQDALGLLGLITEDQKRLRHNSFLIKSKILKILALDALGQHAAADELFRDVVEQARAQDFLMSFLNEGKPFRSYINSHIKRVTLSKLPSEYVSFIGRMLANKEPIHGAKDETNVLTPKEFDVLQNLSFGYQNKTIGHCMGLSETTIKFHLRNIFSKLGVRNRMMAVEVARAKNII
ncbi:MAG: hypothetical protein GXP06_09495 [Alphaproteobacteria bacterium]|nr:hypothetical protein [Alphaproteobacteria bacterium]